MSISTTASAEVFNFKLPTGNNGDLFQFNRGSEFDMQSSGGEFRITKIGVQLVDALGNVVNMRRINWEIRNKMLLIYRRSDAMAYKTDSLRTRYKGTMVCLALSAPCIPEMRTLLYRRIVWCNHFETLKRCQLRYVTLHIVSKSNCLQICQC